MQYALPNIWIYAEKIEYGLLNVEDEFCSS